MEDIKQDIQDATSDYLVSTYITGKSLLDTPDDTIKYIKTFLQPHQYYSEYNTTQDHLTHDLRAEARTTTAVNATAFTPNTGVPTIPLYNSTEEPSIKQ